MSPRKRGVGPDQRRVLQLLQLLARSTNGHTEAMLLAHGFATATLTVLVRDGLATATPETVRAGKRPIKVTRVRITDAGRRPSLSDTCQRVAVRAFWTRLSHARCSTMPSRWLANTMSRAAA
jgi:hypothetical protein